MNASSMAVTAPGITATDVARLVGYVFQTREFGYAKGYVRPQHDGYYGVEVLVQNRPARVKWVEFKLGLQVWIGYSGGEMVPSEMLPFVRVA